MTTTLPACGNCFYYKLRPENTLTGTCRRYPPQFSYEAGVGFGELKRSMVWPVTYGTEWCGEWTSEEGSGAVPVDPFTQKTLAKVDVNYGVIGDTPIQINAAKYIVRAFVCINNKGPGNAEAYVYSQPNGGGSSLCQLSNNPIGSFMFMAGTASWAGDYGVCSMLPVTYGGPLYAYVRTADSEPATGDVYVLGYDLTDLM